MILFLFNAFVVTLLSRVVSLSLGRFDGRGLTPVGAGGSVKEIVLEFESNVDFSGVQ